MVEQWNSHFSAFIKRWFSRRLINEDVIEVDKHKLVQHVSYHIIEQGLEHCESIGQSERHHQVLLVPASHVKGRLPLISFPNQMVGVPKVQLGEDDCPQERLKS
jgi:hypothetical protein